MHVALPTMVLPTGQAITLEEPLGKSASRTSLVGAIFLETDFRDTLKEWRR